MVQGFPFFCRNLWPIYWKRGVSGTFLNATKILKKKKKRRRRRACPETALYPRFNPFTQNFPFLIPSPNNQHKTESLCGHECPPSPSETWVPTAQPGLATVSDVINRLWRRAATGWCAPVWDNEGKEESVRATAGVRGEILQGCKLIKDEAKLFDSPLCVRVHCASHSRRMEMKQQISFGFFFVLESRYLWVSELM